MAEGDAKAGPSSPADRYASLFAWSEKVGRLVAGQIDAALTALDLIRLPDEPIVVEPYGAADA